MHETKRETNGPTGGYVHMSGRGRKVREIDFSHKEVLDLLEMNERTFTNRFARFLEVYDLDKGMFKRDGGSTEDYIWPVEWTELFIALFGNFHNHPFFRTNAAQENLTSRQFLDYYEGLHESLEQGISFRFLDEYIKSLPGYLPYLRLIDSLPRLERKISNLAAAMFSLGMEEPGDVFEYIERTLDEWLFQLHYNHFYISLAKESNKSANEQLLQDMLERESTPEGKQMIEDHLEAIRQEEIGQRPFEFELAELMNNLAESLAINYWTVDDVKRWKDLFEQCAKQLFMKVDFSKETSDVRQLRLEAGDILTIMEPPLTPEQRLRLAAVENYEQEAALKSIEVDNSANQEEASLETRKHWLEKKISILKGQLAQYELALEATKTPGDVGQEDCEVETGCQDDFLEFRNLIDKKSKEYDSATSLFLGQLLLRYFKRP